MKPIIAGAVALGAIAMSLPALATEPAPKPASEHCDDKGHATHSTEPHGCEHTKPATGH